LEKKCKSCGAPNEMSRATCISCHNSFYRPPGPRKVRRTKEQIEAELLAEREKAQEKEENKNEPIE
jgi:hypothetical protein